MQILHSVNQVAGEQAQFSSTSTAQTTAIVPPPGARACLLTAETTSARIVLNGTAPSATNGFVLPIGLAPMYLPCAPPAGMQFASTAGTTSTVNVTWLF